MNGSYLHIFAIESLKLLFSGQIHAGAVEGVIGRSPSCTVNRVRHIRRVWMRFVHPCMVTLSTSIAINRTHLGKYIICVFCIWVLYTILYNVYIYIIYTIIIDYMYIYVYIYTYMYIYDYVYIYMQMIAAADV